MEAIRIASLQELDLLVAKKLMNWSGFMSEPPDPMYPDDTAPTWHGMNAHGWSHKVPHYSSEIKDAWEVVELLRISGVSLCIVTNYDLPDYWPWGITLSAPGQTGFTVTHPHLEVAICLGGLRYFGIEIELSLSEDTFRPHFDRRRTL